MTILTDKTKLSAVENKAVRLLETIKNRGGETFAVGSIMYIVGKRGGWDLARAPRICYLIRQVKSDQIELV